MATLLPPHSPEAALCWCAAALDPTVEPSDAIDEGLIDWERDSNGAGSLDRERFNFCWFELAGVWTDDCASLAPFVPLSISHQSRHTRHTPADLWTDSISAEDYADFLFRMLDVLVVRREDGTLSWVRLRQIECRANACHPTRGLASPHPPQALTLRLPRPLAVAARRPRRAPEAL